MFVGEGNQIDFKRLFLCFFEIIKRLNILLNYYDEFIKCDEMKGNHDL